jgi:aspartate aminotransferase
MNPTVKLAARMGSVKESPIIKVANMARELTAAGEDVVSLSIGVPGFLPPESVYEAAVLAVGRDSGDYLPARGTPGLVAAFRTFLKARGFDYADNEVCVQVGGKGALFNLLLALVNHGDRVVIPAPYWTSYPDMVKLAGGVPDCPVADVSQQYKIKPAQLDVALEGAKAFIFNNPGNPTGMLYTRDEVAGLAEVLVKHPEVVIISDDIYDKLVFDGSGTAHHLLHARPELRERTVIVQSVSKTYGMPGWRGGLVAGPKVVIDALMTLTSQSTTHLQFVSLAAITAALESDEGFLEVQKARLVKQRDLTLEALKKAGLDCPVPQGAFYVFPQVTRCFGKVTPGGTRIETDEDFCSALLKEAKVAVVPGGAFGDDGAVRMSFAGKEAALVEGLRRLVGFVEGLK